MEDIKRTIEVFWQVSYISMLGPAILLIPTGISDFFLDTDMVGFLWEDRRGVIVNVVAGWLILSFFIQEGQLSKYRERWERDKE